MTRSNTVTVAAAVGLILCTLVGVVSSQGTTPNLEEIFVGRCWDYQHVINPSAFTDGREKDCDYLWKLFSEAFMFKDACNVSIDSYSAFAGEALHDLPPDQTMLWTGTFPFVHEYTYLGKRAYAISDTLLGYMANNVVWCGQEEYPGINNASCPPWGSCDRAADLSYWRSVSKVFAEHTEGVARVMLNGSTGTAFRSTDSVFAEYELPNLNASKVSELHAVIVHDYGKPVREACTNGSLVELKQRVEATGITYGCTDDPADIRYLMCVDDVDAYDCQMISEILGHVNSLGHVTGSLVLIPVVALLVLSVVDLGSALYN